MTAADQRAALLAERTALLDRCATIDAVLGDLNRVAVVPVLAPIDLSAADKHECPGIDDTGATDYLVFIGNGYHVGNFARQRFGLSFAGWHGRTLQFDAPGFNRSGWKAIWRIEPDGDTLKAMLFPDPPKPPEPTKLTCRECDYTWTLIEWDSDKYTCPACGEDHEPEACANPIIED